METLSNATLRTPQDIHAWKTEARAVAMLATTIATKRLEQYTADPASQNRGHQVAYRAYFHFADGIVQLAVHADVEPYRRYRYCHNGVIQELMGWGAEIADPRVTNQCDCAKRWIENIQLWTARDAPTKPGVPQCDLVLSRSTNALDRTQDTERM